MIKKTRKSKCEAFREEIECFIGMGLNNKEISNELELSYPTVSIFIQKKLGGNPNYLKSITKHSHIHEKVLKAKLKMSESELATKFNLTRSELKSCLTAAYKRVEFKHIRKETRRRDPWSAKELKILLKNAGVIPRKDINKILKRGKSEIVIKEKLQLLRLCSKNVNGLTMSQFIKLFKVNPVFYLKTTAGSPSSPFLSGDTCFRIVPWCHIDEMIKSGHIEHVKEIELYIEAMAMFQKWVHGKNYWKSLEKHH